MLIMAAPAPLGRLAATFRLATNSTAPCRRDSSRSMMQRSASWARPKTKGHLDAWMSMGLPRMGPFVQCRVSFCLASLKSSTTKTEFPAQKLAPLLSTHRSASNDSI